MIRRLRFVVLGLMVLCTPGCAGCQNQWKHTQSDWVGLKRRITLYDVSGAEIRHWDTQAKIEDQGGTIWFLDANGKAVTVSGTFIVEEL